MPDLAAMLLRRSVDSLEGGASRCSGCERAPLAGERLHELEGAQLLCDLCFAKLPDERRAGVKSRRVGASERRLAVVPKAA